MRYLLLVLLLSASAFGASQNILFILDGSGSMWGHVDGQVKIEVARKVMTELIADLPEDTNVGLMAYGHRRKGDCADIELLQPLAPLKRESLAAAVNGLVPKGKTPISASVQLAVEQVKHLEMPVTIILVSDGLESCGGDPCDAVRAAKLAGVDFRLHVVGFGLGEEKIDELECMAKAGGGEYFSAANAEELAGALKQAVEARPGLVLKVTSNGDPIPSRVFVYKAGGDEEIMRGSLGASAEKDNPIRLELDPGNYDVKVAPTEIDGNPTRILTGITIPEEGEIERTVDFSDGGLALKVTANGEALKARTYVHKAGKDEEVSRSVTNDDGLAKYALAPGSYDVLIRPDGINAPDRMIKDLTVTAGETTEKSVDFSSGTVEVTVTTNDKPLKARTYLLDAESGDEAARGRTDDKGVASYSVPVGEYKINVRPDGIDAPDHLVENVTVTAGETTKHKLDIPSGEVVLTVTNGGEPLDARTYIQFAENGEEAARSKTDKKGVARYSIQTGEYQIQIRPDGIEAPDHHLKGIKVEVGKTTQVAFDFAVREAED